MVGRTGFRRDSKKTKFGKSYKGKRHIEEDMNENKNQLIRRLCMEAPNERAIIIILKFFCYNTWLLEYQFYAPLNAQSSEYHS